MTNRIAVNSQIHLGNPCVAGTRIPVQDVLELVREGITFTTHTTDYYPSLQIEDVEACVQHAFDIDAS